MVVRLALVLSSLALAYLVMELLLFPRLLLYLPLKTHWYLDEGIQALAQYSKGRVIPRDYIALVGDSFAAGKGDWFKSVNHLARQDFHTAHVIHNRTGRDVITFGASGGGSLRGLVGEPLSQYAFMNATSRYALDPPRDILVYFYEGNDLNDNLEDVRLRYMHAHDPDRVYDASYFRGFIRDVVHHQDPIFLEAQSPGSGYNLFFAKFAGRFLWSRARKVGKVFVRDRKEPPEPSPVPVNRAVIGGQVVDLPDALQSPSLELTEEEVTLAVYVFEQALGYLQESFPSSRVGVLYLPSPLSAYQIASEQVSIQTYEDREARHDREAVRRRSNSMSALIGEVAERRQVGFVDSREWVRRSAARSLVHGPSDWKHFNRAGYSALAEAALTLIEDMRDDGEGEDRNGAN